MGSCASSKSSHKTQANPRRKISVYFPSSTSGVQSFSKQECKATGLKFQDIQAIFNSENTTNCNNNNNNLDDSTLILAAKSFSAGATNRTRGQTNCVTRYTAPLKSGDNDEDYPVNQETFKNFDFNSTEVKVGSN